ncbi:MAG: hypothetical protein CME60_14270 [Halobacteriovoraceae bacterium]|nr:hypothetical protein [Halobacteriovoraceae bacterium]
MHNISLWDGFDFESILVLSVLIFFCLSPVMLHYKKFKKFFMFQVSDAVEVGILFIITLLLGNDLPGSPSEEVFEYGVSFILLRPFLKDRNREVT